MTSIRRFGALRCLLALAFVLLAGSPALAQKDIGKIVVGYPPGQSVDVVARLLVDRLGQAVDRRFIVENMAGQSGSQALSAVARMPADGSVITLSASAALAGNPFLYKNLRYETLKDFAPVGLVYDAPLLLLVNAQLPIKSVKELVDYVKANPGKVNYSSPGNGSVSHLAMSEFMRRTGISMTHVPYAGSAKSLTDLAQGEVQVSFDAIAAAQPFLEGGKVRAIAVSTKDRVSLMPRLPTVAESGLPDFDLVPWVGMVAPAGTPDAVIDKLSAALLKITQSPDFKHRIALVGGRPRPMSAAEFGNYLRSEVSRWGAIVKESGARIE